MANKLATIIKGLNYEELRLLKKDLDAGNIEKIIKKELQIKKREHLSQCPICGGTIKENEGLYLEFGPPGFRKKATFDGADCMQYFIEHRLKKRSNAKTTNEKIEIK